MLPTPPRIIDPTVVGIVPPRLTLSPSSVAPSATDTAPPIATASPSTRAPGSSVTEPPIATASRRTWPAIVTEPPMATALSTVSSAPTVNEWPNTTRSDPWRPRRSRRRSRQESPDTAGASARTRRTPSANEARSEAASRTRSSTSPAGRFEIWRLSGRVVALSGAVTTRLQPVCLAIALSASRTVPRGWSMETTGALSGSRPSSRPLAAGAAEASPARSTRATTRTTISLAAFMSDPPSPGSTVERSALFHGRQGSGPGDEDQRQNSRGGAQESRRPKAQRHEGDDDANAGRPPGEFGRRLREQNDERGRL